MWQVHSHYMAHVIAFLELAIQVNWRLLAVQVINHVVAADVVDLVIYC